MARWNRILIVAGLVALGPAVVALSHAGAVEPTDRAAVEDALLLRLSDALAPSASAEANAASIAAHLRAELRGCGTVQVDGALVSLHAAGCTLSDGLRLAERLSLKVHRSARGLTVVLIDGVADTAPTAALASPGRAALAARH